MNFYRFNGKFFFHEIEVTQVIYNNFLLVTDFFFKFYIWPSLEILSWLDNFLTVVILTTSTFEQVKTEISIMHGNWVMKRKEFINEGQIDKKKLLRK